MLASKESEIQLLKDDLNKMVNEYDELMATKSDLEVEIRTYRRLLEGEENRLINKFLIFLVYSYDLF
jgi:hypothetical protein